MFTGEACGRCGTYAHCRFFLLPTDHESTPKGKKNAAFHRSLGLLSYEEKQMAAFGRSRVRPAQGDANA
ncbi:hypothetical protein ACNPQM_38835 [Streptomyces sp. NPDC056231]|uniref:hypothetical protein n=1 Tax=Streptomyces sp. NPDC056231 TaxID=3345755 RepID=UPI003AACB184